MNNKNSTLRRPTKRRRSSAGPLITPKITRLIKAKVDREYEEFCLYMERRFQEGARRRFYELVREELGEPLLKHLRSEAAREVLISLEESTPATKESQKFFQFRRQQYYQTHHPHN
jgi:hypothetical protein